MEREYRIGHYPFTGTEEPSVIHWEFGRAVDKLLSEPLFVGTNKTIVSHSLSRFFAHAEEMFAGETTARAKGEEGANLYYHNVSHAVHQAPYDGITILTAVLNRNDALSRHLTREGVIGEIIGLIYHDAGYVFEAREGENYAARTPIHVEESIRAMKDAIRQIKLPAFLNSGKIEKMAELAIAATKFPYTNEQEREARETLDTIPPEERKEAQIIRMCARLADLGGQTARCDYFSRHLPALRSEMNAIQDGLGDSVIGNDCEISDKCRDFINLVVEKQVGKIANAIYRTPNNTYQILWNNLQRQPE